MKFVIVLLFCMTSSCALAKKHKRSDSHITPAGYTVSSIQDQGSLSGGLITVNEILAVVDARVADFKAAHPGAKVNEKIDFQVWDHWRFESSSGEGASGALDIANSRIHVALYTTATSAARPVTNKPWTIMQHPDTGLWYYAGAAECPALVFELERTIGMHKDIR